MNKNSNTDAKFQMRASLLKFINYFNLLIAIFLTGMKGFAYLVTDSLALLSSFGDGFIDIGISLLNLVAVRKAISLGNRSYRFGFGKVESLVAFVESLFLTVFSLFLFIQAAKRTFFHEDMENLGLGIEITSFVIVVHFIQIVIIYMVFRKISSPMINSALAHSKLDLLFNIGALSAIFSTLYFKLSFIDVIFAVVIAIYIGYSALKVLREALYQLLDREISDEDRKKITRIASEVEGILSIHELKTRIAGNLTFIQFHAVMDANLSLKDAHKIADKATSLLKREFEPAHIVIHEDPEGIVETVSSFDSSGQVFLTKGLLTDKGVEVL